MASEGKWHLLSYSVKIYLETNENLAKCLINIKIVILH